MKGSGDPPSVDDIVALAAKTAFGRPLVTNVLRAIVVEAIVATRLSDGWSWCSADYAAYDFVHQDGTRLEVKQSAARQSWSQDGATPSRASWDVKVRKGVWEGAKWTENPGRNADIYVFAHHSVTDQSADHRDADQWRFFVVPTARLPATSQIGLSSIGRLAMPVSVKDLANTVDAERQAFVAAAPGL